MKTTVEIADPLFKQVRQYAKKNNTTMRAMMESGLRVFLKESKKKPRFKLKKGSCKGGGLSDEFANMSWETILAEIYRGRGT